MSMSDLSSKCKIEIDEYQMKEIFHHYFDDICIFLNYYTHDRQLIEAVLQDIFIKLWDDRHTLNVFYLKTYLYETARNKILNYLRNELNRKQLVEIWADPEIEVQKKRDYYNMHEFSVVYQQALLNLPENYRRIFQQSKEEHKTYKEIAKEHNLSEKAVETKMSTAIYKVRSYIENYYLYADKILITVLVLRYTSIA